MYGELLGVGGKKVGEFYSSSVFLGAPLGLGVLSASYLETHHFNFADGTLIGSGTTSVDGPSRYAVIGGTGHYAGASGTYRAAQRPLEIGGDGTAEFTFQLQLNGGN